MLLNKINYILYNQEKGYFRKNYDKKNKTKCSLISLFNGGTYKLNRDVEEILYDENGKFRGIKSQGEEAYGKTLTTELSYVQKLGKVKSIGKVIRRICILNHPNKPRKLVIKITNDQKIEDGLKYKAQSLEKPSASPLRPHTV